MAMKWFRKHNKKILVAGVVLLMLAFLMPQRTGCGGSRGQDSTLALAFGQKITRNELSRANAELQLLRTILEPMRVPLPTADPLDYLLLLREARHMHIPTGRQAVAEPLAKDIAQANKAADLAELAARLSQAAVQRPPQLYGVVKPGIEMRDQQRRDRQIPPELLELSPAVPAIVPVALVVGAPQRHAGRHRKQEICSGACGGYDASQ